MTRLNFFFIFIIINIPFWGQAQQDSSLLFDNIDTFTITQSRLPTFGVGHHILQLDQQDLEKYTAYNLAHVLQMESNFFVKNYGPSGISTLSGRGGGAAHTTLLWEGFNIQSPMLGQADISLLPSLFVDQISIQYGGESALFGNSSIGGAVHLSTAASFGKGWQFWGNSQLATFQTIGQQIKLNFSNKWYATSFRFFYKNARNNYLFIDKNAFGYPKPIKQQNHALLEQAGLLSTHLFQIKKHKIGAKLWYQNSFREIPPTLLQNSSDDSQQDDSWRGILHWQMLLKQQVWKARTAVFVETLVFQNAGIYSWSKVLSSISELENKWYLHQNHTLNLGINYSFFKALSTGYSFSPEQSRAAFFGSYKWTSKAQKLTAVINAREELVNQQWTRPAVSLGFAWLFHQKLKLNLHLSHNYRLPTFNDLYWNVLGNPLLKPEYSWNSELGLNIPIQTPNFKLKTQVSIFSNLVQDWILWSPNQSGIWRPQNIDKVWAKGLEINSRFAKNWKNWKLQTKANYALTWSTRLAGSNPKDIGKQLIYTPLHQANINVEISYKSSSLLYQHSFTSLRYINNENTEFLPFFQFANLRLNQKIAIKKIAIQIYLQINNIFGSDYQIISNRPLPWQQFELGFQVKL